MNFSLIIDAVLLTLVVYNVRLAIKLHRQYRRLEKEWRDAIEAVEMAEQLLLVAQRMGNIKLDLRGTRWQEKRK